MQNDLSPLTQTAGFPSTALITALYQNKSYREVLALLADEDLLRDDNAELLDMAAICAFFCKEFQLAETCWLRAVNIAPQLAYLHNNLGKLYKRLQRLTEAEACYRQALTLNLDFPDAHHNLALLLMLQGRFKEGLQRYEQRYHPSLGNRNSAPPVRLPFPQWRGESLQGKSILLWPEQGYGDQIQYCRYSSELRRLGAVRITLVCEPTLQALFKSLATVDTVISKDQLGDLPPHDYWSLLMSLALHGGTTIDNIPAALPYLYATAQRISNWSPLLPQTGLRVGLVWKGNQNHPSDEYRSLPNLQCFAPLWQIPGMTFISLQKGQGEQEAVLPPAGQTLVALGGDIADFADCAAIVSQLDLIICVDTAIAHLAGALYKPCWVLLQSIESDWRWFLERNDSPWYPGVLRLFRQTIDEDWSGVVHRVALALVELSKTYQPRALLSDKTENGYQLLRLDQVQALYQKGLHKEVLTLIEAVSFEQIDDAGILNVAAISAFFVGQTDKTEVFLRRALTINPDFSDAHNNLGNLYKELQRFAEAETCYRHALTLQPESAAGYNNLGELLRKQKRYTEAQVNFRQALKLKPDYTEVYRNQALLLREWMGEDHPEFLNAAAIALYYAGDIAQAEILWRRALSINPDFLEVLDNLGNILQQSNRLEEAEACYRRALALKPDFTKVDLCLGLVLLARGNFSEGWLRHEQRSHPVFNKQNQFGVPELLPFPAWQGQSLQGKTILLWPEQGYGDQIQFCRYVALLKQLGAAKISLMCEAPLIKLFKSLKAVDVVIDIAQAVEVAASDYWVRLLSLPLYCATELDSIPADLPYFYAPQERTVYWVERLPDVGLRVGLVWKGASGHKNDANRSLPGLHSLAGLWTVPGITFISLQKGQDYAEAEALPNQPLQALGTEIQDFADLAAVVEKLDLVICVDTAIAHLAGALQKPCWVLLPAVGTDWRWLQNRDDSPWYPGVVRLFRRKAGDDWSVVINQAVLALSEWVQNTHTQAENNRSGARLIGLTAKLKDLLGWG